MTLKDDLPKLKALCRQRLDAAVVNGDVDGVEDDSWLHAAIILITPVLLLATI